MSFLELVSKRESCRTFNGTLVPKELLEKVIDVARLAPSACNGQPWRFIVVINEQERMQLASSMQAFNKQAGAFIVIVEESTNISSKVGSAIKRHNFPQIDIGIVATHIVLEATDLGVSSCIIGWFDENAVKKQFKIPKNKRVRLIISLGYTDNPVLRKKVRKNSEDIVTYME